MATEHSTKGDAGSTKRFLKKPVPVFENRIIGRAYTEADALAQIGSHIEGWLPGDVAMGGSFSFSMNGMTITVCVKNTRTS